MTTLDATILSSAPKGLTLVQLTTMTSAESHALAQHAAVSGVAYLEGQILSYPDDIRAGRGIAAPTMIFND